MVEGRDGACSEWCGGPRGDLHTQRGRGREGKSLRPNPEGTEDELSNSVGLREAVWRFCETTGGATGASQKVVCDLEQRGCDGSLIESYV